VSKINNRSPANKYHHVLLHDTAKLTAITINVCSYDIKQEFSSSVVNT